MKSNSIEEIFSIISNLNHKINFLEQENKTLNQKITILEQENNYLKGKINQFELFIPYLQDYKKKFEHKRKIILNLNSLIIGENEKYNITLKNWINPNMDIKSELLYRMSRDGEEFNTFHNLCDNKGPTLILIKLMDGNILGLYTPLDWDQSSKWKSDLNMFLFSLTENIKCVKNNKDNDGIHCYINYGPYTYYMQFYGDKKMSEVYINPSSNEFIDCEKLYPGRKEGYCKIEELEVHKIIFE